MRVSDHIVSYIIEKGVPDVFETMAHDPYLYHKFGCALIRECIANGAQVLAIVRKGTKWIDRLPQSPLLEIAYAADILGAYR